MPRFQTASSIISFIVATLIRPEIQTMAQEELDAVTGRERLPTFEDRPKLPFVDAICKEVSRWRPVSPLGEFNETLVSAGHGMTTIRRFSPLDDRRRRL
jgi:cytochrome P450